MKLRACCYSFVQSCVILACIVLPLIDAQGPLAYRVKLGLPRKRLTYLPLKSRMISTSGHSSGATAATHFYLANSKYMDGLAIFSSIHYQCGSGSIVTLMPCLRGLGNSSDSISVAEKYSLSGLLDPLSMLKEKKHYIFHGTQDAFINFENGMRVKEFFTKFSNHVRFVQHDAIHSVPSKTCGIQCSGIPPTAGTGCSKCEFSVVFDGLNYIYNGSLTESTAETCRTKYSMQGISLVDQGEFLTPFDQKVSMLPDAILYTPPQCRVNSSICTLHVAFHGCRHSIQNDGMEYIKCSGYLETADANNFIVLFPQVKQSAVDPITLFHCWDLHGYTGPLYGTKLGSQNQVVYSMVSRIMNPPENTPATVQSPWNNEDYYYETDGEDS